jgi:hypothetical protein
MTTNIMVIYIVKQLKGLTVENAIDGSEIE